MPTLNKTRKILAKSRLICLPLICLLSACSIAGVFEKTPQSVVTTETIFLGTNPGTQRTFIQADGIVPNLNSQIASQLEKTQVQMAENYSSANVIVKVKTRFSGKMLKKDLAKMLEEEASFASLSNFEIKEKPQKDNNETTMVDRLIEDPSGTIAGFAIGAAMSNPIVFAPVGMVVGSALNFTIGSIFSRTTTVTILDVEIHEKAQTPIWFTEKRIHKKDEYSIRKYEFSEKTDWKIYKTRIISHGNNNNLAKHIVALVL